MDGWPTVFPIDDFLARFPEFSDEASYKRAAIQNAGQRAMMHIGPPAQDMPLVGPYREYALFLMTGHLTVIDKNGDSDYGLAGTPFKATVGSVVVENSKQNSFTTDDWNYWLGTTKYGRELLAFLETQSCAGIFLNDSNDTVRDLL